MIMYVVWQRIEVKSSDSRHNAECHTVVRRTTQIIQTILNILLCVVVDTTTAPFTSRFVEVLERVELFVHAFSMAQDGAKVKR